MKKIGIVCLLTTVIITGCSSKKDSVYTKDEKKLLDMLDVLSVAENNCKETSSIKVMLKSGFKKEHIKKYCSTPIKDGFGINELLDKKVAIKDVLKYTSVPYFRMENMDRYLGVHGKSIKERILFVNMDLDKEPYQGVKAIEGESISMLVNKHNMLPETFEPSDLVEVDSVCKNVVDFSCYSGKQFLRKDAAKAFESFVIEAKKQDLEIRSIASYRSYSYQESLYNNAVSEKGREYADTYYARPGASEHNTGLAVDITFNNHPYNEIDAFDGYEWIKDEMHNYGFIIRYPKDKEEITLYGHESWHLRYVGKELATKLHDKNMTLEEYYGMK